jgi:hypothetical protein
VEEAAVVGVADAAAGKARALLLLAVVEHRLPAELRLAPDRLQADRLQVARLRVDRKDEVEAEPLQRPPMDRRWPHSSMSARVFPAACRR